MGGTGKTPMVIFLAKILSTNFKVGVVSRGYRGKLETRGGVISDGNQIFHSPYFSGDEPFLIASRLPHLIVGVGKKKTKIAQKLLRKYNVTIILIDDGFQHYSLRRNFDIVLLDAIDPFCKKNGFLREPFSSLKRANVIIFTRSEHLSESDKNALIDLVYNLILSSKKRPPIFFSKYICSNILSTDFIFKEGLYSKKICIKPSEFFKIKITSNQKIFSISGIANPKSFENLLLKLGAQSLIPFRFPDHHKYTLRDLKKINQCLRKNDIIVMTEKDWVKLMQFRDWVESKNIFVFRIDVNISIKESNELFNLIKNNILIK